MVYINLYQQVINEGYALIDAHCININPLIIKRKKLYIDSVKAMMYKDEYLTANGRYLEAVKDYLKPEKEWLRADKKFLDSWNFKFFFHKNSQDSARWLYRMYLTDYQGSETIIALWDARDDGEKQKPLLKKADKSNNDLKEAQNKYDESLNKALSTFDIRNYFIKLPQSKCPKGQWDSDIPDVKKELGF